MTPEDVPILINIFDVLFKESALKLITMRVAQDGMAVKSYPTMVIVVDDAIDAITSDAGFVGHQRITRTCQAIEDCRLANIRTTDQGDYGFHGSGDFMVRVISRFEQFHGPGGYYL